MSLKLNDTTFTQPVIVAVSVAMWNTWVDESYPSNVFSRSQSGEYSALVASGIISLNDCLLIVKERARMMIGDERQGVINGSSFRFRIIKNSIYL